MRNREAHPATADAPGPDEKRIRVFLLDDHEVVRRGLFVPAGQVTKVQQIEIENRGTVPLRLTIRTEDFAQRANGSTVPEPQAPYSAVSWVTITPGVLRISPGTKQFTRIRIHVPAGAEPGDHNLEVLFLAPPQRARATSA